MSIRAHTHTPFETIRIASATLGTWKGTKVCPAFSNASLAKITPLCIAGTGFI